MSPKPSSLPQRNEVAPRVLRIRRSPKNPRRRQLRHQLHRQRNRSQNLKGKHQSMRKNLAPKRRRPDSAARDKQSNQWTLVPLPPTCSICCSPNACLELCRDAITTRPSSKTCDRVNETKARREAEDGKECGNQTPEFGTEASEGSRHVDSPN